MSTLSTLEANSLKGALEALLLVSSDPVSAPALAGALDIAPGECASLLAELKVEYEEANRGFQLREVAGGWRLFTHPAYHDVVEAYGAGTRKSCRRRRSKPWPSSHTTSP